MYLNLLTLMVNFTTTQGIPPKIQNLLFIILFLVSDTELSIERLTSECFVSECMRNAN